MNERDEALMQLDIEYARRVFPTASSDHVLLMAMHKARYELVRLPAELRHSSAAWLREHGCVRMNGAPLLPEGELPA